MNPYYLPRSLQPVFERLFELLHLRHRDGRHVGLVRIPRHEILVIGLGFEELFERLERSCDRRAEHLRCRELFDVRLGHPPLLVVGVKNRRPILTADTAAPPLALPRPRPAGAHHHAPLSPPHAAPAVAATPHTVDTVPHTTPPAVA